MTQPPYDPRFGADWTVPPPPPQVAAARPIQGRKIAAGIAWAMLGHVLAIAVSVGAIVAFANAGGDNAYYGIWAGLFAELAVFLVCLIVGIVFLAGSRGDKGVGLGLLIGWAVGVIVLPVIGFGVCLWAISGLDNT